MLRLAMSLLAVALATPCTAPFMGAAIAICIIDPSLFRLNSVFFFPGFGKIVYHFIGEVWLISRSYPSRLLSLWGELAICRMLISPLDFSKSTSEHQIIVAAELSNQAPDAEYFIPMLDRVLCNCKQIPEAALADAGFFSDANVRRAIARGVEVYIAPARTPHGEKEPPPDGDVPSSSPCKAAMRAKLQTEHGDALYRRRKAIVEPVNGQIKSRGLGKLSLRGLPKARAEWSLIALSHNLLKLHKARRVQRQSPPHGPAAASPSLFSALRDLAARLCSSLSIPPQPQMLTATAS